VAPLAYASSGDTMILNLERTGGVDDDVRGDAFQRFADVAVDIERMALCGMGGAERGGEGARLRFRPAANEQEDIGVTREAARDLPAEIAVAADNQDARHHVGLFTISQKMTMRPPKAGQPRPNQTRNKRS
jgi:hypothetical protein